MAPAGKKTCTVLLVFSREMATTWGPDAPALSLTYAMMVPFLISQTANFYVKMRVSLTSLERLLELMHVPQVC